MSMKMKNEVGGAVAFDSAQFRSTMGRFATGVTVITYRHEGHVYGMTANAFMSVSLEPPLVLVSARKQGKFIQAVQAGDLYGISFLSHDQEWVSRHFGGRPHELERPEFTDYEGVPVISGGLASLVVRAVDIHEAGDHILYISGVEHLRYSEQAKPLLFYAGQYRHLQEHEQAA